MTLYSHRCHGCTRGVPGVHPLLDVTMYRREARGYLRIHGLGDKNVDLDVRLADPDAVKHARIFFKLHNLERWCENPEYLNKQFMHYNPFQRTLNCTALAGVTMHAIHVAIMATVTWATLSGAVQPINFSFPLKFVLDASPYSSMQYCSQS